MGSRGEVASRVRWIVAFTLLLLACIAAPVLADSTSQRLHGAFRSSGGSDSRIGISDAQVAAAAEDPGHQEADPGVEAAEVESEAGAKPQGEEAKPEEPQAEEALTEAASEEAREATKREEELSTPEAVAERLASEYAYTNLSPAQAEELLRERFPAQLKAIDSDPSRVLSEVTFDRVESPTEALVTVEGEKMLLESQVPLRAPEADGDLAKVDLGLVKTEGGFAPANPLVDLTLPANAAGPISIGNSGLAITAMGASPDSIAQAFGEEALYLPEAEEDTGLLLSPTSGGIDVSTLLLSRKSPEQFTFAVTLPQGAELRANESGGAEVIDEKGQVLASVRAPRAVDAQGTSIPVDLSVKGDTFVLEARHRSMDIAYPALIDPEIEENVGEASKLGYWNWQYSGVGAEDYIGWRSCIVTCWGNGLYVRSRSNFTYPGGSYGRWWFIPQGSTTFMHRVILGPMNYDAHGCTANEPHPYVGVWNDGGYWSVLSNAYPSGWGTWIDSGGGNLGAGTRTAFVGVQAAATANIKCGHDYALGGATLFLDDPENPSVSASGIPGGWIGNGASFTANTTGSDPGLGVRRMTLHPQGQKTYEDIVGCNGHLGSTCPSTRNWALGLGAGSLDQGVRTIEVSAEDALGKYSSTYTAQTKVDREKPEVDLEGQFAEATVQEGNEPKSQTLGDDELSFPIYNLEIKASDGTKGNSALERSGVKSIEVFLDGKSILKEPLTNPSPCDSCGLTKVVPVQLTELSPETEHVVKVTVKDQVGEIREREIDFEYVPATGMKDEYIMQRFPLPDGLDHESEAVDQGPELAVNLMNGNLVYHQRDVNVEGPNVDLEVERFYNSQLPTTENTEWGDGWSLAQTPEMEPVDTGGSPAPDQAKLLEASGAIKGDVPLPTESGQTQFNPELQAAITKQADGGYGLADESGGSDTTLSFDSSGQAQEMQTGGPAKVEYDYEGGDLSEIAVEDPTASSDDPPVPPELPAPGPLAYQSAFGTAGSGNGQLSHPADIARDANGQLWVADEGNNRIEHFNEKGEYIGKFGSSGSGNGQLSCPAGVAIDPKGNFWVVEKCNARVTEFNEKGEYVRKFGSSGSGNSQFREPEGIAVDSEGNVWVADTYNARLQEFNEKGEFIKVVGSRGSGPGQFIEPCGIDFGPNGHLWVADWSNNRVEEFDEQGNYVTQFGSKGTENGQFQQPFALDVDSSGVVWVGDSGNNRVEAFSEDGEYLRQFGAKGSGPGQFAMSYPVGIIASSKGVVWVTDTGNNRVERWAIPDYVPEYTLMRASAFGTAGSGNGQLSHPADIARDANGQLWVADEGNNRIEHFNEKGEYIGKFGSSGSGNGQLSCPAGVAIDPKGNFWVVEKCNARVTEFNEKGEYVRKFGSSGSGNSQFREPEGIAVDSEGNVWVADTYNARLQEFNEKGEFIKVVGSRGSGPGQFIEPCGIDFGPNGHLWVADWSNNRVEEFDEQGNYVTQFGSKGTENGQFQQPFALDVDSSGVVWVGDSGNNRVEAFSEDGEYLRQFGAKGSGPGQFAMSYPVGITTDSVGQIWVTDTGNNRIGRWVTPTREIEEELIETAEEPNDPAVEVKVSSGLVSSVEGEDAGKTTYAYSTDDLTAAKGPEGETKYETDSGERLTMVQLPNGTKATIKYEPTYHRVSAVTVDPAGAEPAKTTYFEYSNEPRRTIVTPPSSPVVTYDFAADGSLLKWWNAVKPPEIESMAGSLYEKRETQTAIETGLHNLEVLAHSEEGVASVEIIAGGSTVVEEERCEQDPEKPGIECRSLPAEWVIETGSLTPGILQVEVIVTDRLGNSISKRFWVNIPYTPPPSEEEARLPTFSAIKEYRISHGLDLDLNPVTEKQTLNNRIFDLIGSWNNPNTPAGEVARYASANWGVPMRALDVAEMEYREWYLAIDLPKIEDWGEAHASVYAGTVMDAASGGIIRVGFTEHAGESLAELKQEVPLVAQDRLATYVAPRGRSLASLQQLMAEVSAALESNSTLDNSVSSVAIEATADVVRVGASDTAQAEATLNSIFGASAPIAVEEEPVMTLNSGDRLKAGENLRVRIYNEETGNTIFGNCTSGFGAFRPVKRPSGGVDRVQFLLTAGHCSTIGEPVQKFKAPRGTDNYFGIGKVAKTSFAGFHKWETDALAARLEGISSPRYIYWPESPPRRVTAAGRAHPGDELCFSGVKSGYPQCGTALDTSVQHYPFLFGHDHGNAWVVRFGVESREGDSGAPVWDKTTGDVVGLLAGATGSRNFPDFWNVDWVSYATPLIHPKGVPISQAPGVFGAAAFEGLDLEEAP